VAAELHLAENSLALHLLFQRLEGLVDIVVANENLHASSFVCAPGGRADEWKNRCRRYCACANLPRLLAERRPQVHKQRGFDEVTDEFPTRGK
jgi:hypothetical protein